MEAFDEAVKGPDIVWMLRAPLNRKPEPKIIAVNLFGRCHVSLLQKECPKRVSGRMHPSPRLGV